MSRPRSGSPRYRSFPWDEPGFDTHKLVAELDGDHHMDRKHRPRLEHPEGSWDCFREDSYPEGPQRRSPIYQEDRRSNHEESYHRRASPIQDLMGYNDDGRRHQRLSPVFDGAGDSPRHRGGFKDHFQSFESRGRSPHSPPRLMRERLPQTPRPDPDHRMGWKRDDQGRGRGRFREFQSPNARSSEEQRVGAGRERDRRTAQSPNRDRRRDDSLQQQERNQPPFKRQRREMDDADNMGFRNEDHLREQRYSVGSPREGFGGADRCSVPRGDSRHRIGPLVVEHDHGNAGEPEPPRWDQFEDRGDLDPVFDRQRSPRPMASSSSQERFRAQDNRLDDREDSRGRHFQGDWKKPNLNEPRRSATPQERPNPMRFGNRGDGVNHRGRGGPNQARGQASRGRGARNEPPRNQPRIQHSAQIYQDPSREEPRQGQAYRPYRENSYEDPVEAEPDWAEEDDRQQWKQQDRPGSLERHLPRLNPDPKMPRQRERQWNDPKSNNNMNEMEETLTIKVDMSRPANQNSSLAYSSDRQLSLDLVNVGRQRLDFLPMLEHSGTYRESATHTGTFAQEIITLVHFVKDQYFRDGGVSLNERFSAPQKSGFAEDEAEELTLDERFTSNRGFSLEMDSLFDDDEPLFSGMEPMQPVRGPGDLRHDLERRKQERLEGVRVTISGNSSSQRPLAPLSPAGLDYDDINEMSQMEDEGFSNWPEEQSSSSRRREGNMGQRRGGAPYSTGPQGRNNRFGNRLGPVRRQNNRGNPQEPARYAPCHPPCEPAQYPILPSSSAKGPLQGGRNPLNPDERKRRLAEGLCIYCGEPGHHMAKCPLRPGGRKPLTPDERKRRLTEGLCIYCGEPGHHMAKCPLRPNK